jgi:hypothetical protein
MDWIIGLPRSKRGTTEYNSILTIVDRLTKMAIFVPVHDTMDAPELAEVLYYEVECRFGPPSAITSDRDSRITSTYWAELCKHALIKRRISTAFHPQTDGQTEILNRIVENYLRAFTNLESMNWANLLPTAAYSYNNSYNHSTRITPFKALLGYDPDFHIDVIEIDDSMEGGGRVSQVPAAKARIQKLQQLRDKLKEELAHAQAQQKKYYDRRHQGMEFKRGQLVKLSTRNLRLKDKKLQPRWIGPFRIFERIGSQAYRLALPDQYDRLHDVFPIQLLEPYHARDEAEIMPMPELEDDKEEYEVEEVKGCLQIDGKMHYLVKWTGWPSEYNQWVPKEDMANSEQRITQFKKKERKQGTRKESSP